MRYTELARIAENAKYNGTEGVGTGEFTGFKANFFGDLIYYMAIRSVIGQ